MSQAPDSRKPHLHTLDFLRGIAALSVCLFHFSGAVLPRITHEPTRTLFSWGWLGVEIFFVISGFIIPYVLLRSRYTIGQFGSFIGKRFVRICPPSWVVVGLTLVQYAVIDRFMHPPQSWMAKVSLPQVAHSLAYTIPFTRYEWINSVFWTLAVEFQFYLLVGIVFQWMYRHSTAFILGAALISGTYYLPGAQVLLLAHFSSLFLMGGAALLHREGRMTRPVYLLFLLAITGVAWQQVGLPAALFGTATALLISFVRIHNGFGTFFGRISYSLYLIHILAGSSLEVLLTRLLPPDSLVNRFGVFLLCTAGSVGAAWIFYRLVEVRFIGLAQRWFDRKKAVEKRETPLPETVSL